LITNAQKERKRREEEREMLRGSPGETERERQRDEREEETRRETDTGDDERVVCLHNHIPFTERRCQLSPSEFLAHIPTAAMQALP
jgi:hypothetical protein